QALQHTTQAQQERETTLQNLATEQETAQTHWQQSVQLFQRQQERLELERDILALRKQREQLQAGDPCPLCGATEHPGVEEPDNQALTTLQNQLETYEAQMKQAEQAYRGLDAEHISLIAQQKAAQERKQEQHAA